MSFLFGGETEASFHEGGGYTRLSARKPYDVNTQHRFLIGYIDTICWSVEVSLQDKLLFIPMTITKSEPPVIQETLQWKTT
jgi:hypothetical protein